MTLTRVVKSEQDDFDARSGGSCWGISFIFCMIALKMADPVGAIQLMLKSAKKVGESVETLMKSQSEVLSKLSGEYLKSKEGVAYSDVDTIEGRLNQGTAIQGRHDFVKMKAAEHGNKCIGTLSSFFEGGKGPLIKRFLQLGGRARLAAGHVGLQGGGSHSVAVFWSQKLKTPYFFDPNIGLCQGDSSALSSDLEKYFSTYAFIYAHVYMRT